MPFYVSPEQQMKDKADYARKGIARGRNSVVIQYDDGILFVAPNPSGALHKISEIYDRIAFAAVGRYNEYENLRVAGVRYADTRGYQYDRADVTARGLANWYAQILGTIFTESNKPYEVRSWSPSWARARPGTRCTGSPSTARWPTSTATWPWAARPTRWPPCSRSGTRRACRCPPRWRPRSPPWPARATTTRPRSTPASWRSPCSCAAGSTGHSGGLPAAGSRSCCPARGRPPHRRRPSPRGRSRARRAPAEAPRACRTGRAAAR